MKTLRVDVWSDVACPWCFIGKRRLQTALRRFPHADAVEVVWRAFELDPKAPRIQRDGLRQAQRLAQKYGTSVTQAEATVMRVVDMGRVEGLTFDFEHLCPSNTFDAHRVLAYARECGLQDDLEERFLRGYLCGAEVLGDREVLVRLAGESGLDEERVRAVLASDAYAQAVREDEEEAHRLGIRGVPFFVVGHRYGISGAQSAEVLLEGLAQGWQTVVEVRKSGGPVCRGPERCG